MFLDNLSAHVRQLCKDQHLSYEAASEQCNLSSRYFGDIARGKTAPTILTLEKLCIGFKTTPNGLLLPAPAGEERDYRTPMPVNQVFCMYDSNLGGLTGFPICPRCKISMEREWQAFCDRCGQHLDWQDFAKATIIRVKE